MRVEVIVVERGEDGIRRLTRHEVIRIGEKVVAPAAPMLPIRFPEPRSARPPAVATAVPSKLGVRRKKR